MNNIKFGQRLAQARKNSGLTQTQLAEKLFVSDKAISKWESGKGYPNFEFLAPLCKTLNCSADYLIIEDSTKAKQDGIVLFERTSLSKSQTTINLNTFPNILLAGQTAEGTSSLMGEFLLNILESYSAEEVKVSLIDVGCFNFCYLQKMPHLDGKIAETKEEAKEVLNRVACEVAKRLQLFQEKGYSDFKEYNKKAEIPLPHYILMIEEIDELVSTRKCKELIKFIAHEGKNTGVSIILSIHNFQQKILSDDLLSIFPERVCFKQKSAEISQKLLNCSGAEKLKYGQFMLASNPELGIFEIPITVDLDKINQKFESQKLPPPFKNLSQNLTLDEVCAIAKSVEIKI